MTHLKKVFVVILLSFTLFYLFQNLFAEEKNNLSQEILSKMSVKEKIGQILMPDLRMWNGSTSNKADIPLTSINKEVSKLIAVYGFGGIILFRENLQNCEQIVKLTDGMQRASKIPLIIGVDQEGGIVTRLQNGTNMVGNMALGATRNSELTTETAKAIGDELKEVGINLDFAPVVDVNSNQNNPVIGVRSFGSDPYLVARLGISYLKGLREAGVMSCLKHFPGHGDTVNDTHLGLAVVDHNRKEMERIDMFPFQKCINYGTDFVMAAHVIVPSLDNSKIYSNKLQKNIGILATLSYKILTETLRDKYKFNGVIITDAMNMKAISDSFGSAQATVMAILAGANMVTMPIVIKSLKDIPHLNMFYLKLENEYNTNKKFAAAVDYSVLKILELKIRYDLLPKNSSFYSERTEGERIAKAEKIVNSVGHQEIEEKGALLSITCLANNNNYLPFKLQNSSKILIMDDSKERISRLLSSIEDMAKESKIKVEVDSILIGKKFVFSKKEENLLKSSDFIILCTYNLNDSNSGLDSLILNCINKNHKKYVVLAIRNPYDISYLSNCKEYVAIYGAVSYDRTGGELSSQSVNLKEVPYLLFCSSSIKNLSPVGKIPVDIIKQGNKIYSIGYGITY